MYCSVVSHKMNALIWEEGEKSGRREKRPKKLGRREKWPKKIRDMGNLTACSSPLLIVSRNTHNV